MQFCRNKKIWHLIFGALFTVFYVEVISYYFVIMQCSWSKMSTTKSGSVLKAFMLADIHMLGPRKGHWLDKLRREWQMHRAYQTILSVHKPDVVFLLGDTFDEGEWSNDKQFKEYVERFTRLFYVPEGTPLHIVAGNHDIGFHNFIRRGAAERFSKLLKSPSVQLLTIKESHFVLINSMAMHGDLCSLCERARKAIENISNTLNCFQDEEHCMDKRKQLIYSRPILLQHFPLFRPSDEQCTEPDAPSSTEKRIPFLPKRECLSKESTDYLVKKIRPRVVFGGHTHSGCLINHTYDEESIRFEEHSIPSFSWRNRPDPKYILVTITPAAYVVNKCGLPKESTMVISSFILFTIGGFPWFVLSIINRCRRLTRYIYDNYIMINCTR